MRGKKKKTVTTEAASPERRAMSQYPKAKRILESLVQGIHPDTGTELESDTIINNITVFRALLTAIEALEAMQARLLRRAQLPPDVGKTWSADEERALVIEFQAGEPLEDIATKHKRTLRAIEARLERLGLLTAAQRTTNNSFTGSSKGNSSEGQ